MATYFISDLHLSESEPQITNAFLQFVDERLQPDDELYILGDFFDLWIGDDDDAPLVGLIQKKLKALSHSGVDGFFIRGNRDFLLGEAFLTRCGFRLLPDMETLDLAGATTLIMHGDILCTDDVEYQAFRQQVRSEPWQAQVLGMPLEQRRAMAQQLRSQSQSMAAMKACDIMDVNHQAVNKAMAQAQARTLIHGHTHRPDVHDLIVDDRQCQRIVLGAWHDEGWYLRVTQQQDRPVYELEHFPI